MNENFRQISGYEGLYSISDKGEVLSEKRKRILSCGKNQYGYNLVVLFKDGKGKLYLVHRLVAKAFIPNPDNLPEINHKDEDKSNNSVENLEWCTHQYNCNYGTRNERAGNRKRNGKTSKPVLQYSMDGELIKEWPSTIEIQRQLGYSQGFISICCRKGKSAYGFKWEYKK